MVYNAAVYAAYASFQRGYADILRFFYKPAADSACGIPLCREQGGYLADAGAVRYEMGYASAISVLLFAVMIIVRIVIGKLINKVGK